MILTDCKDIVFFKNKKAEMQKLAFRLSLFVRMCEIYSAAGASAAASSAGASAVASSAAASAAFAASSSALAASTAAFFSDYHACI